MKWFLLCWAKLQNLTYEDYELVKKVYKIIEKLYQQSHLPL